MSIFQINRIDQIFPILDTLIGQRVICGFDWDNTISERNGCNDPLRDGQITSNTLAELNDRNIFWFISTSRIGGKDANDPFVKNELNRRSQTIATETNEQVFNRCIRSSVDALKINIPAFAQQEQMLANSSGYIPLYPEDVITIKIRTDQGLPDATIIYDNVIYSGSSHESNKGRSLIRLMALGFLPNAMMFDKLLFVDNDLTHLNGIINEFTNNGMSDKFIMFYYPQIPELQATPTCSKFPMKECLST